MKNRNQFSEMRSASQHLPTRSNFLRSLNFMLSALFSLVFAFTANAQLVNVPVTGFNNDIVANGGGVAATPNVGVTFPANGFDGAGYCLVEQGYTIGAATPTCFMPNTNLVPSLRTAGLTYSLQGYGTNVLNNNNALTLTSPSGTYSSPFPSTGTLTLATPASYANLYFLVGSVVNNVSNTMSVTVTFTDASTQVFTGASFANWFSGSAATTAFYQFNRLNPNNGGFLNVCTSGTYTSQPNMYEYSVSISNANLGKLVSSVSFTSTSTSGTGTTPSSVNYLHIMSMGGFAPCTTPVDQATALNLNSPSGTIVNGTFTAAGSAPSGYLTVVYPSGATPVDPAAGTTYVIGNSIGTGKVAGVGASTGFSASGLYPGITYDVYVYSYNSNAGVCATVYNTSSPLSGTITTSGIGASLLINPYGDGGFETGNTLALNNWQVVNSGTNAWTVGTLPTGFTNRSAYISNDGGTSWAFTNSSITASHIYKDITFPPGETEITLSFNWKALGEASSWDAIIVYYCPTSVTPVTSSPTSTGNAATWTGGSPVALGAQLWNQGTNTQTFTICLPPGFAGTTQRIVITWKSDTSGGSNPPAAVDNVAIVSSIPTGPANQATSLVLTPISTSQIDGSFTAATSSPTGYLVVRYPNGAVTTNPATGTTYSVGQSIGLGTVVSVGASTTFSNTSLSGSTTYDYYVYDYGTATCSGNVYNVVAPLTASQTTNACGSLTGVIPIGATAPASPAGFTSITNALAYINVNGLGGATTLELQTDYNVAGETYPIVFPFNACVNSAKPLTIVPAAAVASPFVFTSTSTAATFVFDGASYVTIDGRNGGSGTNKFIRIINTSSTSGSAGNAIHFKNESNNNLLTYLDLQASNLNPATNSGTSTVGAVPGVVAFWNTNGIAGNDNNTVSNCNIHAATASGNMLNVGVYAYNSSTVGSPANNDNNTITNCSIYDVFNANTATAAIDILVGNNGFTITNNSYYQTANRTYATSAITHRGFWITPGGSAIASSGYNINGNYIGGTAALCGGTAYTMLGAVTTIFLGMDVSVGTFSASNITNNTIQNIAFTTTSIANPYFVGISVVSGIVNVGNTVGTGNTIGAATGNGSIVINNSTASSTASVAYGIRFGGGTIITANYNTVGAITINNNLVSNSFFAIATTGGGTTSATISNNLVGSLSTTNSIQFTGASTAATGMGLCGIYILTGPATSTITNNVIANMHNSYAGSTTTTVLTVRGIDVAVGSNTIDNNIVRNLTTASNVAGAANTTAICGLVMRSTTAPSTVTNNKIYSLKLNTTSTTTGTQITGIYWAPSTSGTNLLARNFIHSFDVAYTTTTSTAATFTGVDNGSGLSTIQNNMIRLGINDLGVSVTTPLVMRGFSIGTTSTTNILHNSVYIGGAGVTSTVSANHTAAFNRSATTGTLILRNNIFANARTNVASGQANKHYVMRMGTATTGADFDYNDYYNTGGNDNSFALNNATPLTSYTSGWIAGDLNSLTGDPMFLTPAGNSTTVDLHINPVPQTAIEQGGIVAYTISDDYDGQTRNTLTPVDMGADAGNFTPLNPCSGPPASATAAFTNATPICGTGSKTIILSGYTTQPGYTYQWQESVAGTPGSFTNVTGGTGATTNSYTTAILSSSMFYQCVIGCSFGGGTIESSSVEAVINSIPVISATPASGTNVCSGSNVDLSASGASTYSWSCNPGVAGYPAVSLFSTPNNLQTVTSRPTSTLASNTSAPPSTVATNTWTYTLNGTSAAGCAATPVVVVLNVITTAVVPLQLTYSNSPSSVCAPGTPVTFTLNNPGTIGAGQWTYNWYNQAGTTLLQSTTNTSATDTYTPATPIANGNYIYTAKVSNSLCPSSYAIASPTYFVGYTSLNVVTNANCGDNGIITVYPEGQENFSTWYSNNFTTGLNGPAFDALYGNAVINSGRCNITTQTNSQNGTLLIRNPGAVNSNNLTVDFKLSTAPRGFAFNILGADGLAWSYAPDVWQGQLTPGTGGFQAEGGSGTGFKLAFDATANGAGNTPGAYLMYNCTTPDQGPTSSGVLAFKQGSFWQGLVDAPVSIIISEDGYVSVTINNQLIFDHVALPLAYLTANKSNWLHAFTARTGGSNELHAIDDLNIRYNTTEYSITSTTGIDGTWQTTNMFSSLAAGSYPVWVRNPSAPTCVANTGTAVVGTSPSPSSATTVAAPGFGTTVCAGASTNLTTSVSIPGAVFLWESASSIGGPYSPANGINNLGTYTTDPLLANTYFRCTFTCPSASAITSTPALVTVNSGSISSTNSPQMVNCLGDAANLIATPGANTTCVWYADATGGSPLASGNNFAPIPTVLPTTYYVEPVTTLFTNTFDNGGQKVIANTFGTASTGTDIATRFTTTASVRIDIIQVNPGTSGTLVVQLQNAGSATVLQTYSMGITAGQVGSFINVPVNFAITGSGNYQITTSGVACSYYSSYSGTYAAPYMTMGGGALTIVGGATSPTGGNSTSVYGTAFNWTISTSCASGFGSRIPVVVNSNPGFLVSVSPASTPSLCAGAIQALTASSPNAYTSYTWSPVANLYADNLATIPLTITDNQAVVYFKSVGAGTSSFTVSTAGGGCANTANASVTAIAAPVVSATATPSVVASGGNSQLNAGVVAGNASDYVFSSSSATFTPLSGGTSASVTAIADEEMSTTFNIGFNFGFAGTNYSTVQAGSNGVLLFGSGKTNTLTNNLATTTASQRPGLAPLWDDIQCSSGIKYELSGTPGTQVLTVEWLNMEWNYLSSSTVISFQVKLYEGTNVIEYHYRDDGAAVNTGSASIGIMGVNSSDFISLQSTTAAPSTSIVSSNNGLSTKPATGQVYTFTPPNTTLGYTFDWSANPTFLSATNIYNPIAQSVTSDQTYSVTVTAPSGCPSTQTVALSAITAAPACVAAVNVNNITCISATSLSWTASVSPYTLGYYVYVGTDGGGVTTPSDLIFGQDVGLATTINLPLLAAGTTYYYQIQPYNIVGANLTCSIGLFVSGATSTQTPTQSPSSYTETMDNGVTAPALPCGMTSSNENFPQDAFTWYTINNAATAHTGNRHLAIDKNTNNTTAKDDWFYSAPMNLLAGKLYRIYFWHRLGSAGSESFEVFLSNSPDAATMLTTSAVFNGSSNLLTYKLDSSADILPLVDGIYYYGFHANGVANGRSLYMDDIQVRQIPVAALNPASCTTLPSLYDQILVQPVYGAQDYKFKVENLANSFSYEYTRNVAIPDFRLKWAPGVVYDLTYDVSVSYKKNNVWSPYGPSCPVTMGPFPTTQLRGTSCGATLTDQYTQLYIDSVGGANDYEYRIVQNTLAYDHTWMRGAPVLDYRLYWAYQSSPTLVEHLQYGFTYDVQVRALVGRTGPAQGNLPGVFGTFGPVCTVTLAGQPQTQLVAAAGPQQSCGKTLVNITDPIYCIPVVGASNYRYHVVNTALGYDVTAMRNSANNDYRLNWLPTVGGIGLRYATTYDITVSNYVGGLWSTEGSICQVTTPAQPLTQLQAPYCAYTLPTFSTTVYATVVPAATNYRYHITGPGGYNKTIDRNAPTADFKFSWTLVCCGGQNMLPNTAYNVEVASYAGGVWSAYGPMCVVTTGASVPRYSASIAEEGFNGSTSSMSLSVYPNPSTVASEYAVELDGIQSANQSIELSIYNLLGEKVYRSEIVTKEESRMVIKPEQALAPGVYMIEARTNGSINRVKFVVQ